MPIEVVPGMKGKARVHYWVKDSDQQLKTEWNSVTKSSDFIHQFHLRGLKPDRTYQFEIECRSEGAEGVANSITGQFKTAPEPNSDVPIRFIVTTCQAVRSVDSGAEGHAVSYTHLTLPTIYSV